jgi:hypothetical protein
MRYTIESSEPRQITCRRVVNESAVFGLNKEAAAKIEIGPATVYKSGPSLRTRPGERSLDQKLERPLPLAQMATNAVAACGKRK